MQSFKEFIVERVLSIGFNPAHDALREKHRQDIHDILHKSYAKVEGGYSGLGSGSKEESAAIHDDISKHNIKATLRDGKVNSVRLYKDQHGRKSIASGTDGTRQGKKDFMKIGEEDHTHKRAWGEVSGKMELLANKMGLPDHPASDAKRLTGKNDIEPHEDGVHYTRKIGNEKHTKKIVGYPKVTPKN